MDLKILHVFNRGNAPYNIVKGLRMKNVKADLIYSEKEGQISDPLNEGSEKDEAWLIKWKGDSLHPFADKKKFFELYFKAHKYDLIHCHYPSSIFLQYSFKPFVIHETGWIRVVPYRNNSTDRFMKKSYSKAKCVINPMPDAYPLFEYLKYKKYRFIPFGVDTSFYSQIEEPDTDDLIFFNPNRQHWEYKGTDKLLKAFSQFVKDNPSSKLILAKYGVDLQKSIDLVEKLAITKNIIWKDFMDKKELINLYHNCHAVFDQFTLGSYGAVGTEALACGKPLAIFVKEEAITKSFGEMCPVISAFTEKEIYETMEIFKDKKIRKKYSDASRKFALKHHSLSSIADKCIKLYEDIM